MNKKILSILLVLSMLVGIMTIAPIQIGAEGDTLIVTSAEFWKNNLSGKDISNKTITIADGVTMLDFSEYEIEPVAASSNFTFDGNGVVIKGVEMVYDSGDTGLFKDITNATLSNFAIVDSKFSSNEWVGAVAGCVQKSTIEKVYIGKDVTVHAASGYAGGITGGCYGTTDNSTAIDCYFNDCVFEGVVTANGTGNGGIVGNGNSGDKKFHNIYINRCLVTGMVPNTEDKSCGFVGTNASSKSDPKVVLNSCIYAGGAEDVYFYNRPFANADIVEATNCYTTHTAKNGVYNNVKWTADNSGVTLVEVDELIGSNAIALDGWTSRSGDMMIPTAIANFAPTVFTQKMVDGAAVRLDTPTGLRFTAVMGKAYLDSFKAEGKTVTHGIIIAPTDYIGDGEFTVDALGSVDKYLEIEAEKYVNDPEADGYYKYTGVIVKINTWNYERAFSAIAYVKVVDDETQEVTYYYSDYDEAVNSRSVAAIAEDAYNDPDGGYSDDEMDILAGFFQTGAAQ